jgi:hypothetical protein
VAAIATTPSKEESRGVRAPVALAVAVVVAAFVTLGVLIARELMPRSATRHAVASANATREAPVVESAPQAAPAPAPVRRAQTQTAAAPPAAASAPTTGAAAPTAATLISQLVADPESFGPTGGFSPPAGNEQFYNFELLPPFNNASLRRTRANPTAWALDALHGPKPNDLGPAGGVHPAAVAKDSNGSEMPWYIIDSGPLAPAYAVQTGKAIRVMSRDYLLANRANLPAEIAATLDDK